MMGERKMSKGFDKSSYKIACKGVKEQISLLRWSQNMLMLRMKSLGNHLKFYRASQYWGERDAEGLKAVTAEMAAELQKMVRIVNDMRQIVSSFIEEQEAVREERRLLY
jgi:hypothetical protein